MLNFTKHSLLLLLMILGMVAFPKSSSSQSTTIIQDTVQIDTSFVVYDVVLQKTLTNGVFTKEFYVFADDTATLAVEKNYSYNYLNGIYRAYYPDGKIMVKKVFANGKPYGEFTFYDKAGEVAIKGLYKEGIKHGYWAYRYLKCYGRYRKGKKSGKWKCLNVDGGKYITKHGNTFLGDFFSTVRGDDKETTETNNDTLRLPSVITHKDTVAKEAIDTFYLSAITYLARNYYIRNRIKIQFTEKKKERKEYDRYFDYKKDLFLFDVASIIQPLGLAPFLEEKEPFKNKEVYQQLSQQPEKYKSGFAQHEKRTENALSDYATDPNSKMVLYFSEVVDNMVRVDIVELTNRSNESYQEIYNHPEAKKYSLLLLFNSIKDVVGVEYQQAKAK